MKNHTLFILISFVFSGLYAQEETHGSNAELTNVVLEVHNVEESNVSRVNHIKYSIEEYEAMIAECKELTKRLQEYDRLIQNGKMTKAQKRAWKKEVMEAKLLNFRIDDFTTIYMKRNYSLIDHVDVKALSDYYDFSKTLESATQYAGF